MSEAKKVTINNKELKCLICGNNIFQKISTRYFFNKLAKAYICIKCGYIQEFIDKKALI